MFNINIPKEDLSRILSFFDIAKNTFKIDENGFFKKKYVVSKLDKYLSLDESIKPLYFCHDRNKKLVEAKDCGEKIVNLKKISKLKKANIVFSSNQTDYGASSNEFYLRETAADLLIKAEKVLKKISSNNLTFKVTDTFRSMKIQKEYFKKIKDEIREKENLNGRALFERVMPLIADPKLFPPHTTAGAIDLTVIDLETSNELDMGTAIDELNNPKIYIWNPAISENQKINRAVLYYCMIKVGFANMPSEWWHYSYGEHDWAFAKAMRHPIYGIL